MKNNFIKRIIAVILSIITVCAVPLSVGAVTVDAAPVIYIGEMSDNALYANPNKINSSVVFDSNSSDFTGDIASIVAGVVLSDIAGKDAALTMITNSIKSILDPILCAPDGTSLNDVGAWKYMEPLSELVNDEVYTGNENLQAFEKAANKRVNSDEIFFFGYDWRLDPTVAAEELCGFIDHVESVTGKNKVSIMASGYGGLVANTYMYYFQDHALENIDSVVFYNSPLYGNSVIGDFMRGRIARTYEDDGSLAGAVNSISGAHRGEAFMNFINDDVTGIVSGVFENLLGNGDLQKLFGKLFTLLLTTIFEGQDGHKDLGKFYNTFALNCDDVIYDAFLREYLRNMPGLWALVPEVYFDDAVEFMFEDEFINYELNKKIITYRAVSLNTPVTLKVAQNNGIKISIVSNYGYQIVPVTASLDDVSDGIESVKYTSAGAVTADDSSGEGRHEVCIGNHQHVAPDKDINAAYCALPENTWFIKDLPHGSFTKGNVSDFLIWLLFSYEQRTVWDDSNYTQFLSYSMYTDKIVPYLKPGNEMPGSKYGDANLDGQITAADARLVLRYSVELEIPSKTGRIVSDVDGDSRLSAGDARLVLRHSVGLIHAFPVEY